LGFCHMLGVNRTPWERTRRDRAQTSGHFLHGKCSRQLQADGDSAGRSGRDGGCVDARPARRCATARQGGRDLVVDAVEECGRVRTRAPGSRMAARAAGPSLRSISTWPPRRRLYDTLGIQRPSERLEMYFGKLEKRRLPRMGMSNMLWGFATTM